MNPLNQVGRWSGTCGFRMMPTDEFASAPSSAGSDAEADGFGWSLRYQWTHPQDGVQTGALLVGPADPDGVVAAAWIDSWHQKPHLGVLSGRAVEGGVHAAMEYDGWGWTIDIMGDGDDLRMVMSNVIPDGIDGAVPGPYVVMDARWQRTDGGPSSYRTTGAD